MSEEEQWCFKCYSESIIGSFIGVCVFDQIKVLIIYIFNLGCSDGCACLFFVPLFLLSYLFFFFLVFFAVSMVAWLSERQRKTVSTGFAK